MRRQNDNRPTAVDRQNRTSGGCDLSQRYTAESGPELALIAGFSRFRARLSIGGEPKIISPPCCRPQSWRMPDSSSLRAGSRRSRRPKSGAGASAPGPARLAREFGDQIVQRGPRGSTRDRLVLAFRLKRAKVPGRPSHVQTVWRPFCALFSGAEGRSHLGQRSPPAACCETPFSVEVVSATAEAVSCTRNIRSRGTDVAVVPANASGATQS